MPQIANDWVLVVGRGLRLKCLSAFISSFRVGYPPVVPGYNYTITIRPLGEKKKKENRESGEASEPCGLVDIEGRTFGRGKGNMV